MNLKDAEVSIISHWNIIFWVFEIEILPEVNLFEHVN
jgi:hypothetical protein